MTARASSAAALSVFALAVAIVWSQVAAQMITPQSHLGRLVQTFASPFISTASSTYDDADSYSELSPTTDDGPHQNHKTHASLRDVQRQRSSGLQLAPSYHSQRGASYRPDAGEGANEYRMGAYLGPTVDDKDITNAFGPGANGPRDDDERDDADGPAANFGAGGGGRGRLRHESSASSSAEGRLRAAGYAPFPASNSFEGSQYDGDDAAGADEDEPPGRAEAPRARGRAFAGSSARAAGNRRRAPSSFATTSGTSGDDGDGDERSGGESQGQLVAAANGYVPYGALDLAGLVGGAGPAGFQVFNGAGYPATDGRRKPSGRLNRARSMHQPQMAQGYNGMNPMLMENPYGQPQGYYPQQQGYANQNQADDAAGDRFNDDSGDDNDDD